MRRLPLLLVALLLPLVVVSGSARPGVVVQPTWVMTELDARSDASAAYAVNDRGDVVGTSRDPGGVAVSGSRDDPRVVVWRRDGTMSVIGRTHIDLPPRLLLNDRGQVVWKEPGVGWMLWQEGKKRKLGWIGATALNERGQIVGSTPSSNGRSHAALSENGRLRDLGRLPGHEGSEATAINDSGAVVGTSYHATPTDHVARAFLWKAGRMRDLGALGSGWQSDATAINERGQIIGHSERPSTGSQHGFLWQNGRMRDLGELYPDALSDRGEVVGTRWVNGTRHPFLWAHGKLTDLGTLDGELDDVWATAINNRGQVIVMSGRPSSRNGHAAVWENGVMTDLAPTAASSRVTAINDSGQIVGWVGTGSGRTHAVLWTLRSG